MVDALEPLAAKARLAMSRAALLTAMGYEETLRAEDGLPDVVQLPAPTRGSTASAFGIGLGQGVVVRWWHRHPLSSVVQLGEPFVKDYARRHPGKLVAYGAGTGALLWILKPWRLLSAATLVALLFKGSDIAGMISDLPRKTRDSLS